MSKIKIDYYCTEVQLDNKDNIIQTYEHDLPHHDFIKEMMTKDWNDMHMEQYFDGILKNKIASAIMTFRKIKTDSIATVTIEGIPNFRFTEKIRNEICNQIDEQFADGWGEGFFGYANIMTAPDGTKLCVE